ncbi:sugar ABC transporter permease [Archangium violaceum]|uniref:carbohydrate ABC transporter permease n=1 Tax=Archangium violaceum TaxID=83451 RepID=UPI002B3000C1|nr:sugar ABC transporter permease [Archangium violaceum]
MKAQAPQLQRSSPEPRPIRRAGRATPYLFLAPYLVLFGVFVVLPALYGLWISLHDWDFLLPRKPWVGLRNYQNLFSSESRDFSDFWQSMRATGLFTLFSVPFLVTVPLLVALLLNRQFPGRTFFRAVYFAPYVLGVAVVGVLWRFLLDPNIGLVNQSLSATIPWTTAVPWAWISLVGMTVWWTLGFNAIIYLAGLQDIPRELYDAAKVDGATRWQQFLHVTLPGLKPVLLLVLTMTILSSANMFGQSYLVTRGAPANETRTAIMFIADTGLRSFRMGSAAAMSYVLALTLLVISAFNFRLLRQEDT